MKGCKKAVSQSLTTIMVVPFPGHKVTQWHPKNQALQVETNSDSMQQHCSKHLTHCQNVMVTD